METYFEEKQNKQNYAYETLKEMIITNQLTADTSLVERQLCEMLGLSRTPIRAALQELEANNLVKSYPGRGTVVTKLQIEDYIEIFELRKGLDTLALRLCMENGNADVVKRMRETVNNMKYALDSGDIGLFAKYDTEFHEYYFNNTGNKRLQKIMQSLSDQIRRMMNIAAGSKERCSETYIYHERIMEMMESGNIEKTVEALKDHLSDSMQYHIKKITKI